MEGQITNLRGKKSNNQGHDDASRNTQWHEEVNRTYINVTKQIVEAAVAVVRGAAKSFENAEPLCAQRATISCQLCTQDPNIIHPEITKAINEKEKHPSKQGCAEYNHHSPLRVSVVHTNLHEYVAHEAVAVSRAVIEDFAHHGVVVVG